MPADFLKKFFFSCRMVAFGTGMGELLRFFLNIAIYEYNRKSDHRLHHARSESAVIFNLRLLILSQWIFRILEC